MSSFFYDDVQYSKGGWINRNRILREGAPCWLTLPVCRGALHLTIDQRRYQTERPVIARLLRQLDAAYRKAPHFEAVFTFVQGLLDFDDPNVASFNVNLIEQTALRLGICARFIRSSQIEKQNHLAGQERVIDICRQLGASHYVNPIGGTRLYSAERFAGAGMHLSFLQAAAPAYRQFGDPPVPDLSIIDALMFNDDESVSGLLQQYRLRQPAPGPD